MTVLELDLAPEAEDRIVRRIVQELLAELRMEDHGWLDTKQAANYLGLSVDSLHKLTAARGIPFEQSSPNARCWFLRSELDRWRRKGGG